MDGITLSGNHGVLADTFKRYASWNHRDGAQLFVDQARKFSNELYNVTADIAPTKAQIAADVKKLGWKIPRRFADGRMGRGNPSQWVGHALDARNRRVRRRGRKSKADKLSEAQFMAQRPTLAQMQRFVIDHRSASRLYLASGWLGAIAALGGALKSTSGKVDRARGGADIIRTKTSVEIVLWNRTPGIVEMDGKHGLVARAIAIRSADMWVYILRKMNEARHGTARAA